MVSGHITRVLSFHIIIMCSSQSLVPVTGDMEGKTKEDMATKRTADQENWGASKARDESLHDVGRHLPASQPEYGSDELNQSGSAASGGYSGWYSGSEQDFVAQQHLQNGPFREDERNYELMPPDDEPVFDPDYWNDVDVADPPGKPSEPGIRKELDANNETLDVDENPRGLPLTQSQLEHEAREQVMTYKTASTASLQLQATHMLILLFHTAMCLQWMM